jgi:hypothetical protein
MYRLLLVIFLHLISTQDSFSALLLGAGTTAENGSIKGIPLDPLSSETADGLMQHIEDKIDNLQLPFPNTPFSALPAVPGIDRLDQRKKPYRHINELKIMANQINAVNTSLSNFRTLAPVTQQIQLIRGEKVVERTLIDLGKLNVDEEDQTVKELKTMVDNMVRNVTYRLRVLKEGLSTDHPIVVDASKCPFI